MNEADEAVTGTSIAAPAVAGVAAYIVGLSSYRNSRGWTSTSPSPRERVSHIFEDIQDPWKYSYARQTGPNYPPAIYNGVPRQDWINTCSTGAGGGGGPVTKFRRDGDDTNIKACSQSNVPKSSETEQPKDNAIIWANADLGDNGGTTFHVYVVPHDVPKIERHLHRQVCLRLTTCRRKYSLYRCDRPV